MEARSLFAVDPSLTCSGWALFDIGSKQLLAVGKLRSLPASEPLPVRLSDVQVKVKKTIKSLPIKQNDVLICEAQTTMRDPRAAFKVEQVRGIFEVVARENGLIVPGRLNPRSVQNEIMGLNGPQRSREEVKEVAVSVTNTLYGAQLENLGFSSEIDNLKKNQDIVDAILVGALGLVRLEAASRTEMSLEEFFESFTTEVSWKAA